MNIMNIQRQPTTEELINYFTGKNSNSKPLNPVTGAIVPYTGYGFKATPEIIGTLTRPNGNPLSTEKDLGALGALPKEIIAKIFAELSVADIYKLDFGYRKAACLRLAEGIPIQLENFSDSQLIPVAQQLAALSRTCKTFYSLTTNLRNTLMDSKHGRFINEDIKFLDLVHYKQQARLEPNYIPTDSELEKEILKCEEKPIKNKSQLAFLYALERRYKGNDKITLVFSRIKDFNLLPKQFDMLRLAMDRLPKNEQVVEVQQEVEIEPKVEVEIEQQVEVEQQEDVETVD